MANPTTIKKIALDIANVQHNSDVLAQWPIPSIEAMYYAGPFFVPAMLKEAGSWPSRPEELFAKKLLPGKLSNMLFFFLNDQAKKRMGPEAHAFGVATLIDHINAIRVNGEHATGINDTWLPAAWEPLENNQGQDLRRLTFMLDNLNEMRNPVFRALGTQYFFRGDNVYRYYFDVGLDQELLLITKKDGLHIDYFEHVLQPENLTEASLYLIKNGNISEATAKDTEKTVQERIETLGASTFDRTYVVENLFSAFGYTIPKAGEEFMRTPFPEEITEFYVKTCSLPVELLSAEIYKVLGGE